MEAVVLPAGLVGEDGAGGVDMALDEVAAEAVLDTEWALEIDEGAGGEGAEGGELEGLVEEVEADSIGAKLYDGEAASVDGDALSKLEGRCEGDAYQGEAAAC